MYMGLGGEGMGVALGPKTKVCTTVRYRTTITNYERLRMHKKTSQHF